MSDIGDRFAVRARRASDAEGLAQFVNLPGYRYGTMRVPFHSVDEVAGWTQNTPPSNLELVAVIEGRLSDRRGCEGSVGASTTLPIWAWAFTMIG